MREKSDGLAHFDPQLSIVLIASVVILMRSCVRVVVPDAFATTTLRLVHEIGKSARWADRTRLVSAKSSHAEKEESSYAEYDDK